MEIHRPRPWHGWREFLKEIAIVVVGVAIALGGEQAVETVHHREVVRRGEDALRDNFGRFVRFTSIVNQEAPCMTARASELRALIDRGAERRRLDRVGPIPQPAGLPWQIDTWEAMVASGAAPYLPRDRAVLYSRIALSAVDLYRDATLEWDEWGALQSLSGGPRPFGEAEEARARDTLARAVHQADQVRFFADATVERIRRTHLLDQAEMDQATRLGRRGGLTGPMCQPIAVADR